MLHRFYWRQVCLRDGARKPLPLRPESPDGLEYLLEARFSESKSHIANCVLEVYGTVAL